MDPVRQLPVTSTYSPVPDQVFFEWVAVLLLVCSKVTPTRCGLWQRLFLSAAGFGGTAPATQLFRPGIPQDGELASQFRIQSSSCGGWFVWYFMVFLACFAKLTSLPILSRH